jgi:monoamine oxidase
MHHEAGDDMQHQYDAIVIGGGLAGVRAARDVGDAGTSVLLLEDSKAQERLGGRVFYGRFAGTDKFVEYGGGWINPDWHKLVVAEAERYSLKMVPNEEEGSYFAWIHDGKVEHSGVSPLPLELMGDVEGAFHACVQAASRIEFDKPWDEQDIEGLDISWQQWVDNLGLHPLVSDLLITLTTGSYGEDTSALQNLT